MNNTESPDVRPGHDQLPTTRVPKASSIVADQLRAQIVRARLAAGTPLPNEAELIASTGTSRATVREALRLLESEGLVVARRGPGGGLRVGRPELQSAIRSIAVHLAVSEASLGDFFTFRRLVETEAARQAASAATPEQRQRLHDFVQSEDRPLSEVVGFHDMLAESTNNEFFRFTLNVIVALADWHTPDEGLQEHDLDGARAAHLRIVERILDRDGEGAARSMDRHLLAFEDKVRKDGNLASPVIRAESWN